MSRERFPTVEGNDISRLKQASLESREIERGASRSARKRKRQSSSVVTRNLSRLVAVKTPRVPPVSPPRPPRRALISDGKVAKGNTHSLR